MLAAWLTARPARAQAPAEEIFPFRGLSLGPRIALFKPDDGDSDWTGHAGVQARLHFSPVWAVEGSADYRRRRLPGTRVDIFPVQASLVAYLTPSRFRVSPFVLAGAGWYFTRVDSPAGDDTSNRFGPHAGGGLQLWLNRKWSIDASYRHFWLEDIRTPDVLDRTFSDDGHHATGALNFHF